jgi:putative hydrolase of the HAD superfamily
MQKLILMFDFGNVVSFFDYGLMYDRFGKLLGLSGKEFEASLDREGILGLSKRLERGQISPDEFWSSVKESTKLGITQEEFERGWGEIFTLNEPVARLIKELKRQGYTLLLGSNTSVLHSRAFREQFADTIACFDHLIFSHDLGEMKPSSSFFSACLDAVHARPESCVFIDDAESNVEGARACGLQGIVYRSPLELIRELSQLGVNIPDGVVRA